MKTFACSVGIGISLALFAPAFGIENPARTDSVSEARPQHFLLAQAVNQTGTVESYFEDKGFGFITPDDGSMRVFVRFSNIQGGALRVLTPGQKVMYDVIPGTKGPSAASVRAI